MTYKVTKLKFPSTVDPEEIAKSVEDYLNEIQKQIEVEDSLYKPSPIWKLVSTFTDDTTGHIFFMWEVTNRW